MAEYIIYGTADKDKGVEERRKKKTEVTVGSRFK